jgi:biotin carboxylase
MNDILVLLEADPVGTAALVFERARALGLRPVLFSTEPGKFRALAEFDNVTLPGISESTVVAAIDRLGRQRVRGVWALRERLAGIAARVSIVLGRQGADPGPIEVCCDKLRTRQALAEAGVRDVPFALVRSSDEAAAAASTLGGRVVMKPRASAGSLGARLCRDSGEARRHYEALAGRLADVRESGAVVEAAVDGPQFSVQIFDGRSLGVTRQDVGPPPAFITVGVDFPWADDEAVAGALVAHAERAMAAVGHVRGPGSVDLRWGGHGPCIIEVTPRLVGDMIAENIRLATGIDVVEATIRFACGLPYDLRPTRSRGSATRWLVRPGTPVSDVLGREEAMRLDGVAKVDLFPYYYRREGPATDFRDRLACVIAEADSAARAGEIAASGLRTLRVKPMTINERWRRRARRLLTATVRKVQG